MKTHFFNFRMTMLALGAIFTLSLFTLNSCEKDNVEPTITEVGEEVTLQQQAVGDGVVDYSVAEEILDQVNYSAISMNEELGTLKFASDEDLQLTLELIESADNALNEEIYSSIQGLPEEEVDAMEIDDNFAFTTFERNFPNFSSFRAMADAAIEAFFQQEVLNDDEDPSDVYDAIPNVLGTVLNVHGEVSSYDGSALDEQVHIALVDGGNYSVLDGDTETVLLIRRGLDYEEITSFPNVIVVDEPEEGRTCCRSNKTRSATKYVTQGGKKYRAKYRVRIRNFTFLWWSIHRASSQLKSRKKQGWWWKKHYTTIGINQQGNVYPSTYYTFPCIKWRYNQETEQWEPYESTCTAEIKCDQGPLNAATVGSKYAWKYERTRGFSMKVSASDKDGWSGTLRTTFTWKGQTYTIAIC